MEWLSSQYSQEWELERQQEPRGSKDWQLCVSSLAADGLSFSEYLCLSLNFCSIFLLLLIDLFPLPLQFTSILFTLIISEALLLCSIPVSPASSTFFFLLDFYPQVYKYASSILKTKTSKPNKARNYPCLEIKSSLSNHPSFWALSQRSWKSSLDMLPPRPSPWLSLALPLTLVMTLFCLRSHFCSCLTLNS